MRYIFLVLFFSSVLNAAPAMPFERSFSQNDGSRFKAHAVGDEYLHYIETKSGDILVYNPKTKNYEFATVKGSRLAPSGLPYKKRALRSSIARTNTPTISKKELQRLRQIAIKRFKAAQKR